ncbi:MAG: nucleotidyltransferase family protein, partial [Candidatus Binataceae bacterium]
PPLPAADTPRDPATVAITGGITTGIMPRPIAARRIPRRRISAKHSPAVRNCKAAQGIPNVYDTGVKTRHPPARRDAILCAMADEFRCAVLLAAGRGTRLGDLTAHMPKPLLEIGGAPLIEHIVRGLIRAGLERFIVVTGYLSEQLEQWAKSFERENFGITIAAVRQPELNGTGGAMLAARPYLAGEARFVFGWGDILMDPANYPRFMNRARTGDYDLLLAVNRTKDPYRGGAVYLTPAMRVERIEEKPAPGTSKTQWNNAGLFAAGTILFDYLERLKPSPRGELELPGAIGQMIAEGRVVRAIDMRGLWSDIGTPADLAAARVRFRPHRQRQ